MPARCITLYLRPWKKQFDFARNLSVCARFHQNHYDVLEVAKDASLEEVKEAFIRKSKLYHPDKHHGDQEMNDKFIKITEAYNVLSDPEQRAMYNHGLSRGITFKSPHVVHRSKDYQSPYQKRNGFTTDWSDFYSTYGGGKADRDMKRDADSQFWKDYWEHTKKYGGGGIQDSMSPPPKSTVELETLVLSAVLFIIFVVAFFHSSSGSNDRAMDHDSFDSEHLTWLKAQKKKQE